MKTSDFGIPELSELPAPCVLCGAVLKVQIVLASGRVEITHPEPVCALLAGMVGKEVTAPLTVALLAEPRLRVVK